MMQLVHGFLLIFFLLSIAPVLILFEMVLPRKAEPEAEMEPAAVLHPAVGKAAWLQEVPTYARQAAVPYFRRGAL